MLWLKLGKVADCVTSYLYVGNLKYFERDFNDIILWRDPFLKEIY